MHTVFYLFFVLSNFEKHYFKIIVDDRIFPWGVGIEFIGAPINPYQVWKVIGVLKGGQCESLGVKVGWNLTGINGRIITPQNFTEMFAQFEQAKTGVYMFEEPVMFFFFDNIFFSINDMAPQAANCIIIY